MTVEIYTLPAQNSIGKQFRLLQLCRAGAIRAGNQGRCKRAASRAQSAPNDAPGQCQPRRLPGSTAMLRCIQGRVTYSCPSFIRARPLITRFVSRPGSVCAREVTVTSAYARCTRAPPSYLRCGIACAENLGMLWEGVMADCCQCF